MAIASVTVALYLTAPEFWVRWTDAFWIVMSGPATKMSREGRREKRKNEHTPATELPDIWTKVLHNNATICTYIDNFEIDLNAANNMLSTILLIDVTGDTLKALCMACSTPKIFVLSLTGCGTPLTVCRQSLPVRLTQARPNTRSRWGMLVACIFSSSECTETNVFFLLILKVNLLGLRIRSCRATVENHCGSESSLCIRWPQSWVYFTKDSDVKYEKIPPLTLFCIRLVRKASLLVQSACAWLF